MNSDLYLWYFCLSNCLFCLVWSFGLNLQGPLFLQDLPYLVEFSNSSGSRIDCNGHGTPPPKVEWITSDKSVIQQVPSTRVLFTNGSLYFPPFSSKQYNHDIHSTVYKCRLQNSLGTVVSNAIHVKAVLKQSYDIRVNDVYVTEGNTAVLKCKIPNYVADYVIVTSWIQDDNINIYPNTDNDGKYVVYENGDLYVSKTNSDDGYKNYACRTIHRLTGEVKVSTYPGRIIVSEPINVVQLRINIDKYYTKRAVLGVDVILPCIAQGHPVPNYYWIKEIQGHYIPITVGGRLLILSAGLLKILKVRLEDRGAYICIANNSVGEQKITVSLEVTVPLSVHIQPQVQVVDIGKKATFHCIINGYPVTKISWLHNGELVAPSDINKLRDEPSKLIISQFSKTDRGMYQCLVSNNWNEVQAIAELDMGDTEPELVFWFSEQTLQPGPTISLKCIASGNPPPQFTWTLDGFPIPNHPRFLVGQYVTVQDNVISHVNITSIKSEDGGEYTCTARNTIGKVSYGARINVFGYPYIRQMPKITGISGQDLVIKCPVAGYPIETVTWEKNGQLLPLNRRQKVYHNGTLVLEQTQRNEDAGTYICRAQSKQNSSAKREVEIQIIVPPKIIPINPMMDLLKEGMRAAITCQIMEGDLPISFRWEKNGNPISNNITVGIVIRRIDQFSTNLIIDPIISAHSGNYTCIAENSAGVEKQIVPLTVNVSPKWTLEPTDTSVAAGRNIALHCQADGYPIPEILWKKSTGHVPGEYKDILFEPNLQQYSNGTLSFRHISKDKQGHYLCEAKNHIGLGVSKVIFLKVHGIVPAHFSQKTKHVQAVKGEQTTIQCLALGDSPMEVVWFMNNNKRITDTGEQRFNIRERHINDGVVSELIIQLTNRKDTGTYVCTAKNDYGHDDMFTQLLVQEVPESPQNILVTEQSSRTIGLSWKEPYAGNSAIENYIIQFKLGSDPWPEKPLRSTVPGTQTNASLQNLRPAQIYYLRVLAENTIGLSGPSEVLQVSTLEEVPSGPPLDVRAEAKSSTEIIVTWEPPVEETWNGNLLGYHVGYQKVDNKYYVNPRERFTYKSVEVRIHFGGKASLEGLFKYTSYNIVVKAYNSRGSGPESIPITARTLEDKPTLPPENVKCIELNAQNIYISWDMPLPEGCNGQIKGYKINYHITDQWLDEDNSDTKVVLMNYTTLTGLKKYANYSITALAFTSVGDGVKSEPVYCHTKEDVPSAPAAIKALLRTPSKIIIVWLPPKYANGVLSGYTLYMKTLEGREEGTHKRILNSSMEIHETDRSEDATYQFWITASTKIGEGEQSETVTVAGTNQIAAKIASFGKEIITSWKQDIRFSCRCVGIPTPNVTWSVNNVPLASDNRHLITENSTLIIKDVQSIDEANYSCNVENEHGKDKIIYTLKVLVPPGPPVLKITESFTDSLHLKWISSKNGGSPILGYVINYKRDYGDWEEIQVLARVNKHILRNLWCGTKYLLYITAYNRIGTGLPCDIITAQTKGSVPEKPNLSQMLTVNATVATVWLDSWGNGGCGILYFAIEYRIENLRSPWIMVYNNAKPTKNRYSIPDLRPATQYELKVTAFNNAGNISATYKFATLTLFGELSPPTSHSTNTYFTGVRFILPMVFTFLVIIAIVAILFWRKKIIRNRHNQSPFGESPTMAQLQNKQNADQQYLAIGIGQKSQCLPIDTKANKNDSLDCIEDICPYATFQLSKSAYNESCYSGNIYSGPYHSVGSSFVYHSFKDLNNDQVDIKNGKEPEYSKVRRKRTRTLDRQSESQESDNLGSTDSEVKKILTLHLPISEFDVHGTDSDGDGCTINQKLVTFSQRMHGSGEASSSSSEHSFPSASVTRKSYVTRKSKPKTQALTNYIRSSRRCCSHNDETTFSISHTPIFKDSIHSPKKSSDLTIYNPSEPASEERQSRTGKLNQLTRESFQINV